MSDRIGSIHLKQFIGKLIEKESSKADVLALIDRYIDSVKSDKEDLVKGLQQILDSPKDGRKNAESLVEKFGKMPKIIFSNGSKSISKE